MQVHNEQVDKVHNLMFAVLEMQYIEMFLAKEFADAYHKATLSNAKAIYARWAQDCDEHSQDLQRIINNLQKRTLTSDCRNCLEEMVATSFFRIKLIQSPSYRSWNPWPKELYTLFKMHLRLEKESEDRYASMALMTDDKEIESILLGLSAREKAHHGEAQSFIDDMESKLDIIVKSD